VPSPLPNQSIHPRKGPHKGSQSSTAGRLRPNGAAMRALRVALKVSLRQVQQLTGLDRGHLSRLERGLAGAGPETIRRYAAALDVPTAAITHAPHPTYATHDITSGVAGDVPHDGKV